MSARSRILLAAVLLAGACTEIDAPRPPPVPAVPGARTFTLSIDGKANGYDRAAILFAVNDWNVALAGAARIAIVDGPANWHVAIVLGADNGQPPPYVPSVTATAAMDAPRGRGCKGGDAGHRAGLIRLYPNCQGGQAMAAYVRHELGHLLGLGHVEGGVMAAACCISAQAIDTDSARRAIARIEAAQ